MLIGNEGKHRAYTIALKSYTDGKAHNPTDGVVSQSGTPQSHMNYRSQLGRSRGHSTQRCDRAGEGTRETLILVSTAQEMG